MAGQTITLVPARLGSTRLPDKPLADIGGRPMIVHVVERAREADLGRVVVATDAQSVVEAVRDHGGEAVMTRDDHVSGSDRIFEALQALDPDGAVTRIVNVQGDLPTVDPAIVRASVRPLDDPEVALSTLATPITGDEERDNQNVVKMVGTPVGERRQRALYFTRAVAPWGEGVHWHHIGLYAWDRAALARFVALPPSPLEMRERLEQLRALEAGMRIDVVEVDTVPLGVDTLDDLKRARIMLTGRL